MPAQIVNVSSAGGPVTGRVVIGRALWGSALVQLRDANGKDPNDLADFDSDDQEAIEQFDIGDPDKLDGYFLIAKVRVAAWTEGAEQYYLSLSVYQGEKMLTNGHLVSQGSFTGVRTVSFRMQFELVP